MSRAAAPVSLLSLAVLALAVLALAVLSLAVLACDRPPSTTPPTTPTPTTTTTTTTTTTPSKALPQAVKLHGEIFASDWQVTIIARDAATLARARVQAPAIAASLAEVERQLSLWQRDSELARFNRTAWTKALPISPGLGALLTTCLDVGARTDGAFDITIGPLLDVWGFSPEQKGKVLAPPSAATIAAAKARTGRGLLHVTSGGLQKERPDLVVDVTAVGDGAAAAAVMNGLRERGFHDVLVDVAGEVVVAGAGLSGPWKVGVNVPDNDAAPDAVLTTVALAAVDAPGLPLEGRSGPGVAGASAVRALSTSGTYREALTVDGRRYPHILDPRTGAPVTHDLVSCTIVADDIVIADAVSTACVVLGEAGTRAVLARFPGASALFVTSTPGSAGAPGATFTTTTTEGFPPAP